MTYSFDWLPFDRLSGREVHDVLQLRQRVFVVEQTCPFLDADGLDPKCWHGLGRDEAGLLVATARLVPPGLKYEEPAIGRVVTAPEARRTGAGRALMSSAIQQVQRLFPGQHIRLGAQRYLETFYGSFGFRPVGEPYDEDGIDHIEMLRG
ncbi:MAG: GNAT family N-acetyltransferase [Archangium sp.]|nr:GNAT family N-acetyltransferase [Archangium sp.]MDP3153730.1 GNAT family N-acetyltransferase [Archangium sp.]MDP3569221.1 GNAT family N-acetyltransferase [Archangium sp.]